MTEARFTISAADNTKAGTDSAARNLAGVKASAAELGAALGRAGKESTDAAAQVSASAARAAAVIDKQNKAVGVSAAQTAAALRQVPAQFTDIIVSLQAGQSPLTVLLQQGGQLKDAFGGIGPAARALGGYVAGLVSPLTAAAAAMGVLAYATGQAESSQRALNTLAVQMAATGRAAVLSADGFKGLISEMARMPNVTKDAAREALSEFSKAPAIGKEIFRDLSLSVADFARATGTDVPAAARVLAGAFADPKKGAETLEAALGTLKQSQLSTIEEMTRLGDTAGAQRVLLDALREAVGGLAANGVTPLQRATNDLGNAWTGAMESFGNSGTLRTANDLLVGIVEKAGWLIKNLPMAAARAESWFSGGLNGAVAGMARSALGVSVSPSATAAPKPQTGGASGSWGLSADDEAKNVLKSTKDYQSKAGKKSDVEDDIDRLNAALDRLKKTGVTTGPVVDQLKSRVDGARESLASMGKGAASAAAAASRDGLAAEVQQYRNRDKEILDNRKDFLAQLTLESQLGQKNQLEVINESAAQEARTWAERKANFADEIATTGKKKNALAEVQRIQGQMRDAERDHEQAMKGYSNAALVLLDKRKKAVQDVQVAQMQDDQEAYTQEIVRAGNAWNGILQSVNDYGRGIDLANEMTQVELGLMGRTETSRAIALEQYRVQLRLREQILAIERSGVSVDEQAKLKAIAETNAAKEAAGASDRVFLDQWKKTADGIESSLTDALLRGFEAGNGFGENLVKTLKNMFGTLVLRPVISAIISPVTGAISGATAQLASGSGGLGSLMNYGSTAYQAYTGQGFTGQAIQAIGNYFGIGAGAASAGTGLAAVSAGYGLSAGVGTGLGLTAGASSGAGLAAGYGLTAGTSTGLGLSASTAASSFGAGITAGSSAAAGGAGATASALGSLGSTIAAAAPYVAAVVALYMAFKKGSWQTTNSGYSLGVSGADLGTASYKAEKRSGGLFGGDDERVKYGDIDPGTGGALQKAFGAYKDQLAAGLSVVGIDFSKSITGFVEKAWDLGIKDLTPEQQAQQLATYFGQVQERMAQYVLGADAGIAKEGEGAAAALTRIVSALQGVNPMLDTLGVKLYATTLAGGSAASKLQDAFGGPESMQQSISAYYEGFYTQQQKVDTTTRQLTGAFAALGYALPTSRDQLKGWIDTQFAAGEAGQNAAVALVRLAPAFGAITKSTDDLANAAKGAAAEIAKASRSQDIQIMELLGDTAGALAAQRADELAAMDPLLRAGQMRIYQLQDEKAASAKAKSAVSTAFDALGRSVDAERKRLNEQYDTAVSGIQRSIEDTSATVSELTSLSRGLRSALDGMAMVGTEGLQRKVAQGQIGAALTLARSGRTGEIDQDRLGAALGTVSRASDGLFADYVSYAKDYAQTVNAIGELSQISDAALSIEEQSLNAAKRQLDVLKENHERDLAYYDSLLASGKSIVDTLNGNDVTVKSILEAIRGFNRASSAAGGGSLTVSGANGTSISAEAFASFRKNVEDSQGIAQAYLDILGRNAEFAGQVYYEQLAQAGTSLDAIRQMIANSDEAKQRFAINGSHATGLDYVPFDGYIARLHQGERVQTAEEARISRMVRASNGLGVGAGADGGTVERLLERILKAVEDGTESNELALSQASDHARTTADGMDRLVNRGVVVLPQ